MASFDVDFSQAQGAGTGPLSPAEGPKDNWGSMLGNAAGLLARSISDQKEKDKQAQIDAIVGDFTGKMTAINDALDSGAIQPHEANARQRAIFNKYSAQYPTLVKHFNETNTALTANTSLGDAKQAVKDETERNNKLLSDMQGDGWPINRDTPKPVAEQWKATFLATKKIKGELEWEYKRNAEQRAQNAEGRSDYQFSSNIRIGQKLAELADTHVQSTLTFIDQLSREQNPEKAKADMLGYFSMLEGKIAAVSADNPALASNWNKMFGDLRKAAEDAISPTKNVDALKAKVEEIKYRSQLLALKDPRIQGASALNSLMPQMVANLTTNNRAALETMERFTEEGGVRLPVVGNPQIEGDIYKGIGYNLKAVKAGRASDPEAVKKDLSTVTGNILTQLDRAMANELKPAELKQVVDFIASPDYSEMVKMGIVSKDQAAAAKSSFQYLYQQQVAKSVAVKLDQNIPGSDKSYKDAVDLVWTGSGLTINKKFGDGSSGWGLGRSSAFKNIPVEEAAKQRREQIQFGNELAPVGQAVNTLVRAGAHMEGHTDYSKYWEENKHYILPQLFHEPSKKQEAITKTGGMSVNEKDLKPGYEFSGFRYLGNDKWERI